MRSMQERGPVAFVHIPRTAGGSLKSALALAYGRVASPGNVVKSVDEVAEKLRRWSTKPEDARPQLLVDHVPLGLYERYLPGGTRYITMLRDPVERALSHYFSAKSGMRVRRTKGKLAPPGFPQEQRMVSIGDAISTTLPVLSNLSTRFLCGAVSLDDALPADAVERATANLARFEFVGITEQFEESLRLLGGILEVDLSTYETRHVKPQDRGKVRKPMLELLRANNQLDAEVYAFALDRFEADKSARIATSSSQAPIRLRDARRV
jgi:hypothetical protein